ncbi:MAG TPA: GNAT family N-acetyltransferase [Methylomirabilota bacterium]|nr:GNAT family N-acetyltransferase [Methylomirabilota bacterium]
MSDVALDARFRIAPAQGAADIAVVRDLFREYADGLGVSLDFQGFDEELATLPGTYAPPAGRLLLARRGDDVAGCVGLRPLDDERGEMKRLYLRPRFRGTGLGRRLAEAVIAEARAAGYRSLVLDSLATMQAARGLYDSLGFRAIPAYYDNPLPGVLYAALDLAR